MNITYYLNKEGFILLKRALPLALQNRNTRKFFMRYILAFAKAVIKRKNYMKKTGKNIPVFLIASIADQCNLTCTGCYARANSICSDEHKEHNALTDTRWRELFIEAKNIGVSYILLAGGEPFTRYNVIESTSKIKEIIFPVFTNATMFDDKYYSLIKQNRNIIPVISLEGDNNSTDKRRGHGVYEKILLAIKELKKRNIIFGLSITVSKENFEYVVSSSFVDEYISKGVSLFVYTEYVPIGKDIENTITDEMRMILESKINSYRNKTKKLFLSFPGDEKLFGGCLASGRGFFHINSNGAAEPCPFSPYSDINLKNNTLLEALNSNLFEKIRNSKLLQEEHKGGCVLFENEDVVKSIVNSD